VLDLDVEENNIVSGYSYTYFYQDGKKYYTICKIKGKVDPKKKSVEVTETARTKTNVPDNITNSFQLHKLKWHREAGKEILEGNWQPAPGQDNHNTGYGTTQLSKRALTEISSYTKKTSTKVDPFSAPKKENAIAKTNLQKNNPTTSLFNKNKISPSPITKQKADKDLKKSPQKSLLKIPLTPTIKKDTEDKKTIITKITTPIEKTIPNGFEKRNNAVLQRVNVENATVKIELYDNGDVDGDSISLFYNGAVLLAHKKLTTQPIVLELPVNDDTVNELVMYADNLGTIPPNTALMIVMDGNKRYEVRVTSDLKKSGTIQFTHKKKE
jgi:hypothetical protein